MGESNAVAATTPAGEPVFELISTQFARMFLSGGFLFCLGSVFLMIGTQSGTIVGLVIKALFWCFVLGGIAGMLTAFLRYPRLCMRDGTLISHAYPGWTTTFDLAELGKAHVVTQTVRFTRHNYLVFYTSAEEQAMTELERAHKPTPFNAARRIYLTSLIGNDLFLAQELADTINRHRPAVKAAPLTVEQATRNLGAIRARKWRGWFWLVLAGIAGAALEFFLN